MLLFWLDRKQEEKNVKTIFLDAARVIKRMRPAPQGRGYRVRKRSNHVTVFVDTVDTNEKVVKVAKADTVIKVAAPVVAPKKTATKKAAPKKKANSETE